MKLFTLITISIIITSNIALAYTMHTNTHAYSKNRNKSHSDGGSTVNPYKDNASPFAPHSLFKEGDNPERMSTSYQGVPPPIEKPKPKGPLPDPERIVASRLVEQYRKQFDYLDSGPVDDCINPEEMADAFKQFNWPKGLADSTDDEEYSKLQIQQYDGTNKNCLNFVEFCKFMEDLWNTTDELQEQRCKSGFDKAMDVWKSLFKWLDRDNDGNIVQEDMMYGISKMMYRDAVPEEVTKTFTTYGKDNKLNFEGMVLAIANGVLDETFKDPNFTASYIK